MPKPAVQSLQTDSATPAVTPNVPTMHPPPLPQPDKLPYAVLPENIPELKNTSGESLPILFSTIKSHFPH